jgi:hypothetical protein
MSRGNLHRSTSGASILRELPRAPESSTDADDLHALPRLWWWISAPVLFVLGCAALAVTPLLILLAPLPFGRKVIFRFSALTVVPLLSRFLDTIPTWLVWTWWLHSNHIAQDGERVLEGVALGIAHR